MKVLVSNDDGIDAKGITVLAQALETIADVWVVAPNRDQSGASHSLTLDVPMRVQYLSDRRISVPGTPTDCVHLACTGLLDVVPDVVVSGINHGANLGDDVLYSGTVAAAFEGRFLGLPSIAISLVKILPDQPFCHFDVAANLAKWLINELIRVPLPAHSVLNINIPDLPRNAIKGFEITRLGTRHLAEPTIKAQDPRGNTVYWVGKPGKAQDAGPGTDFYAVGHKKVSITPLQGDLTNYTALKKMTEWLTQCKL